MNQHIPSLSIDDFTYDLPAEKIAAFPPENRGDSKLLVYRKGATGEDKFSQIGEYLPAGAMLVFNNTRVIHARLRFKRATGAVVEILCLEPAAHGLPEQAFRSHEPVSWNCIVGNLRRWKDDALTMEVSINKEIVSLTAVKKAIIPDGVVVEFSWSNRQLSFADILEKAGELPIPPYLNRDTAPIDEIRYNTVYAKHEGSVAAPTAGLHFTPELIDALKSSGVAMEYITLHVGAGTFKPVKSGPVNEHIMHEERFVVSLSFLEHLLRHCQDEKPVIPVGTTAVRTIESIYWLGVRLLKEKELPQLPFLEQWYPYQHDGERPSLTLSLKTLVEYLRMEKREELTGYTQIMIVPGYTFNVVDGLITNFHQPGSSLLLLIAALTGSDWRKIYDYALSHEFRFLSYGDSSLLIP